MILFTDLDGTLLTDSKELTKENQDAIREAIDCLLYTSDAADD